jgi:hypothetical protein
MNSDFPVDFGQSFADVNTEGGVDTLQFLEASTGLVGLFGYCNACGLTTSR